MAHHGLRAEQTIGANIAVFYELCVVVSSTASVWARSRGRFHSADSFVAQLVLEALDDDFGFNGPLCQI